MPNALTAVLNLLSIILMTHQIALLARGVARYVISTKGLIT